jgi:hypothetical protein
MKGREANGSVNVVDINFRAFFHEAPHMGIAIPCLVFMVEIAFLHQIIVKLVGDDRVTPCIFKHATKVCWIIDRSVPNLFS